MGMLLIVAAGWLGVSLLSGLALLAIAAVDGSLAEPPSASLHVLADEALAAGTTERAA